MATFKSREEAGRQLALNLQQFNSATVTVLAIPRGGTPVAQAVCRDLSLPLNVVPIRAMALPHDLRNPFGCVSSDGELFINQALAGQLRVSTAEIARISRQVASELKHDLRLWGIQPPLDLTGQTVLIIDDGMHTGWTMASALAWAASLGATCRVAAAPVSPARTVRFIQNHCDQVIALQQITVPFYQISFYYESFPTLDNTMMKSLLQPGQG